MAMTPTPSQITTLAWADRADRGPHRQPTGRRPASDSSNVTMVTRDGAYQIHRGGDVVLGEQEAAAQQEDKAEEGAPRGGNILIAAQAAVEAEQADAHVVQLHQQQDQLEEHPT